jgi:hypothetical protein
MKCSRLSVSSSSPAQVTKATKLSEKSINKHKTEESFKQRSCNDHDVILRREQDCPLYGDRDVV